MEKRYHGFKYTTCFCDKKTEFQIGEKLMKYIILFMWLILPIAIFYPFFSDMSIQYAGSVVLIIGVLIVQNMKEYRDVMKRMQDSGHSEACSSKIAVQRILHYNPRDDIRVMKTNDDGKRVWW